MLRHFPSPLYAILDIDYTTSVGRAPMDVVAAWLDAGVRLIQLRAKTLESGAFLALAERTIERCRSVGAVCIVNDRADIAVLAGADGVHVGQDDLAPTAVRRVVGADAWVGLSTHTDTQMDAACRAPVSYVAIGPVFSTATKQQPAATVGLEGVRRAAVMAGAAGLPLVAIGGITLETAPGVRGAGADAVAVIADLHTGDPHARVRAYLAALL